MADKNAKFFRVAVEGPTTDGREIGREALIEAAEEYDPEFYHARINIEHITGYLPDSPFRQYGDVLAMKSEEIKDGKLKGKMALYAQIEPLPELVEITTKNRQKLFTSVELWSNFAKTGKAYVSGIAVTDTPASLGTQPLKFSADNHCYSAALEIDNPFIIEQENNDMKETEFLEKLKAVLFSGFKKEDAPAKKDDAPVLNTLSDKNGEVGEPLVQMLSICQTLSEKQTRAEETGKAQAEKITKLSADLETANKNFTDLKTAHDALVEKLSKQEGGPQRETSAGTADTLETLDCL